MNQRERDEQSLVMLSYAGAMQYAQLFETNMVQLAHLQLPALPADATMEDALARLGDLLKKTAGQLANQLDLPEPVAAQLKGAVKTRNVLAHHFLRGPSVRRLRTSSGREAMFRELMAMSSQLYKAVEAIDPEIDRQLRARGVDPPEPPENMPLIISLMDQIAVADVLWARED